MYLRRDAGSACENGRRTINNLTETMNNLQNRASCTWNYAIDHNASRIPAELVVAHCVCPSSTVGELSWCEPVLYPVPVKRFRGDAWINTWDLVTVGCTSVENDQPYTDS